MKLIAFDLDTAGTKPRGGMIVEIGAVLFGGPHAVKCYVGLASVGMPSLADGMVAADKPCTVDVLGDFAGFYSNLPFVAHHARSFASTTSFNDCNPTPRDK